MRRTKAADNKIEYSIWLGMKKRCLNKNHKFYLDYGGRGIKICLKWKNNFEAFLDDMGKRPSKGLVLDRIDNNKGYSPKNCRWATLSQSALNTRIRKDNKTGFKGIYFRKDNQKYRVFLYRNNTRKDLGHFSLLKDAVRKYKHAVALCDFVIAGK